MTELFVEERKKGVLDVSQIPSSITSHGPGYIDRDNEIIVGLQTEAPLKRAIMPNGGLRMVVSALETYGYEPDPKVVETFTKYRKTHNDGVFDAYTDEVRAAAARISSPAFPTLTAEAESLATIVAWHSTVYPGLKSRSSRRKGLFELDCPRRTSSGIARS